LNVADDIAERLEGAMLLRFHLALAAVVASVVVSPKCVDLSLIKTAKEHLDDHGA